MNVFRIRPLSTATGDFVFADIVQKTTENWYDESTRLLESGAPFHMKWNHGFSKKRIGDLTPSTAPGYLFSDRAILTLGGMCLEAKRFQVIVQDGREITGLKPKNYEPEASGPIDHFFKMYPRQRYGLATEVFKQTWERLGFTGATFELVDELDDGLFLTV